MRTNSSVICVVVEGAGVPSCISLEEHLQLIDTGVMLNTPYPPFLGEKRDADLLIALDYGADDTFMVRRFAAAGMYQWRHESNLCHTAV